MKSLVSPAEYFLPIHIELIIWCFRRVYHSNFITSLYRPHYLQNLRWQFKICLTSFRTIGFCIPDKIDEN